MERLEPKNNLHREFLDVVYSLVDEKTKNGEVELAILGGSVARGDMGEHSDIDIVFYVSKENLAKHSRGFYKYKGKFIEDSYFDIKELKLSDLIAESVPVYDPNDTLKNWIKKSSNEDNLSSIFKENIESGKKFLNKAEESFHNDLYKESLVDLLTMSSYSFILLHSLPPRFNRPFPTFKLFESVKEISKDLNSSSIYELTTSLYPSVDNFIDFFEEAYNIMFEIQKEINPGQNNYGFFDPLKIEYNIEYMRDIITRYPKVYASRFAVGCLVDWAWGNVKDPLQLKATEKYRDRLNTLALSILGIEHVSKEFVKAKLETSIELSRIINELIEKDLV